MSCDHFDVVVIGGGPAGSTAAGFLAQSGRRVVLLEKERLPRYHIGESLLSATLPIFGALGVLPEIERAGFIPKPGGTFVWGMGREPWSFFFRDDPGGHSHAYHVVRSEFDHILVKHAVSLGVDVREEHRVRDVSVDNGAVRVRAQRGDGGDVELGGGYLIDASGQDAFLGRRDRLREFNPFFRNLAVFGYFADAERLSGAQEGNILSVAFDEGWFWFIPLSDGTTSVGAVVDAQRFAGTAAKDAEALYRRLIGQCEAVARRLVRSRLASPVRIVRDYSYSSRRFHGDRFLLAGDAACFIDPVFSTGVHLACLSGYLAARCLGKVLAGEPTEQQLALYDQRYRALFERYLKFLYFFYDHHCDASSYFWQARKLLGDQAPDQAQTAFTHLVSGAADFDADRSWADDLADRRNRIARATTHGRLSAMPDAAIFRATTTVRELKADD